MHLSTSTGTAKLPTFTRSHKKKNYILANHGSVKQLDDQVKRKKMAIIEETGHKMLAERMRKH